MKCLILAGGRGERMWPLSRKDLPKQFIRIQKNHSIFQETVARNMAYCDEFIIVTSYECRSLVSDQMSAFQGLAYRCIYEEEPRHTTAAITLACMGFQPSEYVFVVPADHLIDTGDCEGLSYKDAILRAKDHARADRIVLFGIEADDISRRFGYFTHHGETFIEKPGIEQAAALKQENVYQNVGMLLFQAGVFLNELKTIRPDIYAACSEVYALRKAVPGGILYESQALSRIEAVSVERSLIEPTRKKYGIEVGFGWSEIGRLEDLYKTGVRSDGAAAVYDSEGTEIINNAPDQTVVVNGIDDAIVVNTADAVYIGKKDSSYKLKEIFREHADLRSQAEAGLTVYRDWGSRERLAQGDGYLIRKVTVQPGRTIYEHSHSERSETWNIIQGCALITINGKSHTYERSDSISVSPGLRHQISNPGSKPLVFIETVTGDNINDADMTAAAGSGVTEKKLGLSIDPVIKLLPAYKDYLWGGTRLRDIYKKECDYDIIAESWELSAHPAGNSIVASGRHKGQPFSRYLERVGREVLGWKCEPLQSFPILIKLIDAKQNLSVQVHPDDDYALANENEYGKNEMWYVIDSEPGAGLYVGFSRDVSREEVSRRVKENTIMEVLNFYPTKPGDIFFIPAGTVHAIGAGNLICEIQQSSNCTYRLYDYDRRDKFGNPRELHLEKALDVLSFDKYVPAAFDTDADDADERHVSCKYFEASFFKVNGEKIIQLEDDTFHAVLCIDGEGSLDTDSAESAEGNPKNEKNSLHMTAGETVFIPAADSTLKIEGKLTLVITKV